MPREIALRMLDAECSSCEAPEAIRTLVHALLHATGRKPVVLVDGIDRPVAGISDRGVREDAAGFMKLFVSSTFKSEPYHMAYVTGTLRADSGYMYGDDSALLHDSIVSDRAGRFRRLSGGSEDLYDGVAARMLRESDPSYRESLESTVSEGAGTASLRPWMACDDLLGGDWSALQGLLVHTGCLALDEGGRTVSVPDGHAECRLRSILRGACREKQEV